MFRLYFTNVNVFLFFFFSSRRRHTRYWRDWSSDVCSSDLFAPIDAVVDACANAIDMTIGAGLADSAPTPSTTVRSEERRVGKECRSRCAPSNQKNESTY